MGRIPPLWELFKLPLGMKMEKRPVFRHDCEQCVFLGTTNGLENAQLDLYWCEGQGVRMPTVVARYGNDGPQYKSGLGLALYDRDLWEAARLAEARGLYKREAHDPEPERRPNPSEVFTFDVIKKYTGFGVAKYDMYGRFVEFDSDRAPYQFNTGPWMELIPESLKVVVGMLIVDISSELYGQRVGPETHNVFIDRIRSKMTSLELKYHGVIPRIQR